MVGIAVTSLVLPYPNTPSAFAATAISTSAVSQREADMCSEFAPKDLGERVANFLRARHPSKTAANVAAETPFSEHRVKAWLEHRAAPDGLAIVVMTAAYGPEFLAAVMPQKFEWIDESARRARGERIDAEIAALKRERAALDAH